MRALELRDVGVEHLRLVDRPPPHAGSGEVLLRMRAAALGLRDYKMVTGAYASAMQRRPLIPGGEGVGEVVELGSNVGRIRVGDRVNPLFVQQWWSGRPAPGVVATSTLGGPLLDGSLAEYMVVPEQAVVPTPEHLSDVEAATLPFAGLTAWTSVAEHACVRAGDVVVIQGTSAIPLFALQFAKLLGAEAIVTSKSDVKLERAKQLGADHVINYSAVPEWSRIVLELTHGLGADLVLDPGGTVTMAQSIRAVRPGGTIAVFTALGSAELGVLLPYLLGHNIRVQGVNAGSRDSHAAMARAIESSRLRPVIERVVALESAAEAVAAMPRSEQFGKVCVRMDGFA
jgi:NADPH:quinone reductase-like Zn-dependent oxidoreductase